MDSNREGWIHIIYLPKEPQNSTENC
jgi:hypothetical protein